MSQLENFRETLEKTRKSLDRAHEAGTGKMNKGKTSVTVRFPSGRLREIKLMAIALHEEGKLKHPTQIELLALGVDLVKKKYPSAMKYLQDGKSGLPQSQGTD